VRLEPFKVCDIVRFMHFEQFVNYLIAS